MKYLKLFEEQIPIKVGNIYKHKRSVDGEHRVSIGKLIVKKIIPNNFGEFQGFYIFPEHCKGEPTNHVGILSNMDEDSIPTPEEIKEYELLNQMNKYNL
jgi:hypothetical protein